MKKPTNQVECNNRPTKATKQPTIQSNSEPINKKSSKLPNKTETDKLNKPIKLHPTNGKHVEGYLVCLVGNENVCFNKQIMKENQQQHKQNDKQKFMQGCCSLNNLCTCA